MENNDETGKVYLRKDGRYSIKYKKGIKEDVATDYGFVYGSTEEETLEKYKSILSETVIIDKSLFSGDIYNWLKSVKISCKKSSYSNYEYSVYAHLIPEFGKYKRKQINKNIINELNGKVDYILDSGNVSNDTTSTIVEIENEKATIIREGKIKKEEIAKVISLID